MNKHFYLKHEIMAFSCPRIRNMLRQERRKSLRRLLVYNGKAEPAA